MIPRFRPPLGREEVAAALTPGGPRDIEAFEAAFAAAMEQSHAVAFPYGRTGLIALLRALGLEGHAILCPAYTCVVVANAIVVSGNTPVFVDAGADANADLGQAAAMITGETGALIATSIFGHPVDLDRLHRIRERHPTLPVIQDCAHSFICEWKGRPVHREGVAALFGLNVSKTVSSIFGGLVTTDDSALANALRRERTRMLEPASVRKSLARLLYLMAVIPAFWPPLFSITERLRRAGLLGRLARYYSEDTIDMPPDYLTAMTPLEARVGRLQVARLRELIDVRRAYAAYYRQQLAGVSGLAWLPAPEGSSFSQIAARVADRRRTTAALAAKGIQVGEVIEYSVPELAAYQSVTGAGLSCPVAAALARQTINLPTSFRFDRAAAGRVVAALEAVLGGAAPPPPLPLR